MKRLLITNALVFSCILSYSQITTVTGLTPTQYVNNVLLGNGVTASNVSFTGYGNGIAQFNAPASANLGFSTGLYLTTGSALQNDPYGFGGGTDGPQGPSFNLQSLEHPLIAYGDVDLHVQLDLLGFDTTLTGFPALTNDLAILEFDFVPTSDTISFRYRFASEEYNDYVNDPSDPSVPVSIFNDIFAFLLKGVSPAAVAQYPSYKNIALVPNSNIPVSIFTVNNGYSLDGIPSSGPCVNCAYYVDNVNSIVDITYDGITAILTAKAPVICGETYHIKLAVADVGDQAWDSGVFIEGGSFSSPGSMSVVSEVAGNPNNHTFVEGCNSGSVTLIRTDLSHAQDIQIIYGGTSVPTDDFSGLPSSVHFNAGQGSAQINLQAINDGISEGNESFSIGFIVPATCGNNTDTLFANFNITDPGSISVDAGADIVDCNSAGINQVVTAVVTGGSGNITYSWNTGAITPSITVTSLGQYIVTVTDACNQSATDTVEAILNTPNPLNVSLAPDFSVCPNIPVSLQATATGGNGAINFQWSNGANGNPIQFTSDNTTTVSVTATDACGQTAMDNITITVTNVNASFNTNSTATGVIDFTNHSTPNGLTYHWDFGDGNTSSASDPQHTYSTTGEYLVTLTVSNADGCEDIAQQKISFSIPSEVFIPSAFTPGDANGINDSWLISISYLEDFKLYVFDRWGHLVYETDNIYENWNGTYRNSGKPMKSDRYSYRIIYTEYQGKEKEILGSVTLVK